MKRPPREIAGAKVLHYAIIDEACKSTGKCKHHVGGHLMGPAAGLAICRYLNDTGYYLYYCGPGWKAGTDTHHETVDQAKRQAEFEYEGVGKKWCAAEESD